jgi:hypothetical protein
MTNDPVLALAAEIKRLDDELAHAMRSRDLEAQEHAMASLHCIGDQFTTAEPTTSRGVGVKLKDALVTLGECDDSISERCTATLKRITGRFSRGKPQHHDIVSLRAAAELAALRQSEDDVAALLTTALRGATRPRIVASAPRAKART